MSSSVADTPVHTREERLRNLERERALFSQNRLSHPVSTASNRPNGSQAAVSFADEGPSGSHNAANATSASSRPRMNAAQIRALLDISPKNFGPSSPTRNQRGGSNEEVCYATNEGFRGRIHVDREGKHSFVDDVTSPNPYSLSKSQSSAGESQYTVGTNGREEKRTRASSGDAWRELVNKEQRATAKHYGSDKALLGLLEEERSRYAQLEGEYHKLLKEVQALHSSHLQELRNTERRYESNQRSLEKELSTKSTECSTVRKELQNWQEKYAQEAAKWTESNERLEANVQKLQKLLAENQQRAEDQEKTLHEYTQDRKELSDRLSSRTREARKIMQLLREKETECLKEKECRVQLEAHVSQLDQAVAQRDEDIKLLKSALQKRNMEHEESVNLRHAFAEARKEIDRLLRREKQYLDEVEKGGARERKLLADLEELSSQHRKYVHEVERLTARQSVYLQDIEHLKGIESNLRTELQAFVEKNAQQLEEISQMDKQLRKRHNENIRLSQDLGELRTAAGDLRTQNDSRLKEIQQFRLVEDALRAEKEELISQRALHLREIQSKQQENAELSSRFAELTRRLETEISEKLDLKQQNKERLVVVADKISDLQASLTETQGQLQQFREAEASLRRAVRERDDVVDSQERRIAELQATVTSLQSQLNAETMSFESLKTKKKEEFLAVQEKFSVAKSAMEQEVGNLRANLQQKALQIEKLNEEISRLRIDGTEASADRLSLEARISELSSIEASYQRQIKLLQATINQKEQDNNVLGLKYQSVGEQLQRLQEEVNIYRNANNQKDDDLNRLQGDLSRKLRNQVDLLLQRDGCRVGDDVGSNRASLARPSPSSPNVITSGINSNGYQSRSRSRAGSNPPTLDINISTTPLNLTAVSPRTANNITDPIARPASPSPSSYVTTTGRQWSGTRPGAPRATVRERPIAGMDEFGMDLSTDQLDDGKDWDRTSRISGQDQLDAPRSTSRASSFLDRIGEVVQGY
ncbi:uncharacterized protein SPPG_06467 [Spizellomyces punctatus DAOM BR117]|uniref:Uncharacterized protein n=1 Tax=Spizellomyces punctatus (strain DAOM BR117) TaxID=645134 RepID=A0A0L0HBF2_SPIPD|nr:uncharacterized protein SPPG_06467 [Spizellomyces punctatus DAOM BR117]KNC98053.1 hypothetical protein SPPG_06467 [Spizellomyces punctatus DAOM BR117]|eukprot:XP_016606093.1 hypothetical protein SPPG_06467 [Spizellomyces punctatus DAOM BR117]